MNLTRWISGISAWWQSRHRKRVLHRAIPVLRELDRQEAECRRLHRRGAKKIVKARRDAVHRALAASCGMEWRT